MNGPVPQTREHVFDSIASPPLDLLVIGGGIVGAGIARDAALRGLRVGLVEQHDFAFGTSSRSSRLLHGGLRYLAQGRLGLVTQASVEKRIVHRIAPHLADPLPFVFPAYQGSEWKLWPLRLGVKIYDLLCLGRNLGRSSSLGRDQVLQYVPGLNESRLLGAVRYYDGFTNDARLVIDTLRSAASAGAVLMNYCRYTDAAAAPGGWECALVDELTRHERTARTRCVVNATGPWADGLPHSRVKLRLTKGIHVVLDRERLSVPEAVVMTDDKRILFAIPWGRRVILGTTETGYQGAIENAQTEPADIRYLLDIANGFFPRANLTGADLVSSWAGVRPLKAAPGADDPADISRAHEIQSPEPGWWDVSGGKLTTYRLMAEQTLDRIVRYLGRPAGACRTANEPLLLREKTKGPSGILPPPFNRQAVEHYCRAEWAVHLDDVLVRRSGWHYYHADAEAKAEQTGRWMSELLGWAPEHRDAELERYRRAWQNPNRETRNPKQFSTPGD